MTRQYYYHKGKVIAKAVAYSFLSAVLVALGVFCFVHWELGFLFSDWKGYLMLGVYGLITLGSILSTIELFRKSSMASRGIPAFGVGADCFVVYDRAGLSTAIAFEDCERVRFKRETHYRGSLHTLTLIIVYHDKADAQGTKRVEINLSELDRPQRVVDRELKKVYNDYKKAHEPATMQQGSAPL